MFDLVRKALLLGVGAASMTEERIRALADELIAQGGISREEGERMVKDVLAKAEESRKDWDTKVRDLVREGIRKIDLVPRSDYETLVRRLEVLEERVRVVEHK
jgi:polyhydroxyalkanoate synthesis regulator phasin